MSDGAVMEIDMAPSLGCQMLRSATYRNGRVQQLHFAENLRIGDPDPSLFQVPPDYRIKRAPCF
jgi:hypothetical protein